MNSPPSDIIAKKQTVILKMILFSILRQPPDTAENVQVKSMQQG